MAALRYGDHNKLIACRICDCIFTSQKDLFDHIQLHLLLDESETKRKLLLNHMSSTFHPPAPPIQQQHMSSTFHPPAPPIQQQHMSSTFHPPAPPIQQQQHMSSTFHPPAPPIQQQQHMSSTFHPPAPPIQQQGCYWPRLSSALSPGVINVNPFSIGANARNLDQQSTVRPLPVSLQSTAIPTLPRHININPISIGADAQSTVRPLPVSYPSTVIRDPTPVSGVELFARPFLQQLEDSLQIDGMAFIKDGGKAGNQEELDVTLKL